MKLLEVLKSIGVDWRDRRLIERLYIRQRARARVKDNLTNASLKVWKKRKCYIVGCCPMLFLLMMLLHLLLSWLKILSSSCSCIFYFFLFSSSFSFVVLVPLDLLLLLPPTVLVCIVHPFVSLSLLFLLPVFSCCCCCYCSHFLSSA